MNETDTSAVPPWSQEPPWAPGLVRAVEAEASADPDAIAGWPDPHDGEMPDERDYSVVTDAQKYRILDQRIEAWGRVLARRGIAELSTQPHDRPFLDSHRPAEQVDRLWVLRPAVRDGLSVLFARAIVEGEPFGIDIAVASSTRPPVRLESVPDCGCDACDRGSQGELDRIDNAVLTAARGGVVHARRGSTHTTAGINQWSATGDASETWLDPEQRVTDDVERWTGAPWLAD